MRIAYFTESLPPLTDGVSHTLSYLRRSLIEERHEFIFVSPFVPGPDGWNGKVYEVISMPFPLYTRYRLALPAFHDLKSLLGSFGPEIIHICSPFFLGMAAINYARAAGIPVVTSYHTRFVSYLKYYGFGWFERFGWKYLKWFYGRTDRNFVPSRATIAELASKGFSNLELWERGVDTRQFSPIFASTTLRRSWSPEGAPIALYIGRLVREKDIDILLKACMMLKERGVEFKPVFVGEGPMYDEIAKTLPDAILAGFLRGDDLSRAYASADFFVFPSTTESFGNVVLEAAASGLPCVVAGEGGVTNLVVDGETGLIAQPREAADLALKMELLMGNEMLRNELSAKALEYASVKSWSQVNRRLFEGYSELIEVGGEPASKGQEATFAWRH